MKEKRKTIFNERGITLIALVVTIVVLLILAAVSIGMLTGENGIITQASNSKKVTELEEVVERARVDILGVQANNDGKLTKSQFVGVLENFFIDTTIPNEKDLPEDMSISTQIVTAKEEYGGYEIKLSEIWNGKFSMESFNLEKLTIGDAIDSDKYGWKVTNYNVKIDETGCWRLFFKDSNYTYLISDNCIESYIPGNNYSDYKDGSFVSNVGKRLNKMLLDAKTFFVEGNVNENIRATAWLTDTEVDIWKKYENSDTVFAIGSPTVELYKASFDATAGKNKVNTITLDVGEYGYIENIEAFQLKTSFNYGIYNKNSTDDFFISSPSNFSKYHEIYVNGASKEFGEIHVTSVYENIRPIVCMPTSIFESDYEESLVDA